MIKLVYCEEHSKVLAANHGCVEGAHKHGVDENGKSIFVDGVLIDNIDEPNYDGSNGFKTSDGTIINDANDWLVYLEKYIPLQ